MSILNMATLPGTYFFFLPPFPKVVKERLITSLQIAISKITKIWLLHNTRITSYENYFSLGREERRIVRNPIGEIKLSIIKSNPARSLDHVLVSLEAKISNFYLC